MFKLAAPAFMGMFVQTMYNTINTIFIGQFVGTEAIAGLSIVFPLQMLMMGLGMMVGVGGLSVISRSIGAGDDAMAEHTLGNCFTASVALAVAIMIIILPFMDFWLRLIGASDAVLPYAKDYLGITIASSVFTLLSVSLLTLVRAEGNTRIPMMAMILASLLSIGLSALFIIVLGWGIKGAASATAISQVVSMLFLLSYYFRGKSYLEIHTKNFKPDTKILKAMFSIGIASFMQTTATSISSMILLHSVVKYGGDIALGAFGIIQRIMMISNLPAMTIGQGLQPLLGFNYGAKRFKLAIKGIYLAYLSATVLSVIAFIFVYHYPGPIVQIFRNDPELIEMGAYAAKLTFLALPLMGILMVSQMIFQALGRATQAFITAIARPIVFLVPLVLILPHSLGLDGVFLSLPAADTISFILAMVLLIPIINEFRQATAQQKKDEPATISSATTGKKPY